MFQRCVLGLIHARSRLWKIWLSIAGSSAGIEAAEAFELGRHISKVRGVGT